SLLPTERAALPAELRQQLPERTRAVDALELASFAIGDDGKGTEPAIDAHRTCLRPARPALGMQGRGFYIQTHPPVSPLARPSRVLTVANKIFARPLCSIRRNRRVLSRTRTLPSFGKRTTRA